MLARLVCTWLARHAATAALEVASSASLLLAASSASRAAVSVASAAVLAACKRPHVSANVCQHWYVSCELHACAALIPIKEGLRVCYACVRYNKRKNTPIFKQASA